MTLNELLREHPEWGDLPMVVYRPDGSYDYVGHSGSVYLGTDYGEDCADVEAEGAVGTPVLVFAGN